MLKSFSMKLRRIKHEKTVQLRFDPEFTKDEYARIWIALVQYRKYQDFIGEGSMKSKNNYTRLAKKVENKMHERKVKA